jgi:MinD-like ATPase involved in chromosome partitioning or flagellar assembly
VLERYYNVILTDCGTGLLHAATRARLSNADSVVVVSSSSLDGARSASATLDWLEAHGREDLATSAVAIVNEVRPGVDPDDVRQIEEHFAARCRAVERVPYDPHLATGDVISLDELMPETRQAFVRIAAAVMSGTAVDPTPTH